MDFGVKAFLLVLKNSGGIFILNINILYSFWSRGFLQYLFLKSDCVS